MMFTGRKKPVNNGNNGGQRKRDKSHGHEVSFVQLFYFLWKLISDYLYFQGRRNAHRVQYLRATPSSSGSNRDSGLSSAPSSSNTLYSDRTPGTSSSSGVNSHRSDSALLDSNSSPFYRSSVSDLTYERLFPENTNTRIRRLSNRRGAVKHQKYVKQCSSNIF